MSTKTVTILESNALAAYRDAEPATKKTLEKLFENHKQIFNQKITDRVKTWDDACDVAGISCAKSLPYQPGTNADQDAVNAFFRMTVICSVLNEGWKPNWNNSSERKWYPWFDMRAGFAFSASDYDHDYSNAGVGSRLCFKTEELAIYAGKQFLDIYKAYLTLPGHE